MRAIVCVEPGRLERVEREAPVARDGWATVDVAMVGICGTDYHTYSGIQPFLSYPRVMGHELSGRLAAPTADGRFKAGDAAVINPYISCGHCHPCLRGKPNCCMAIQVLGVHTDGGMCERIVLPEANLYPSGGLSMRDIALVEPLAIGAHAVRRSGIRAGDRVLVAGMGPIGIGVALFAHIRGAAVVAFDRSAARLAFIAERLGFSETVEAGTDTEARLMEMSGGNGYDAVFDATGNSASMEACFARVAHGGVYVLVGLFKGRLSFDDPEFHKREITLMASRNATREDFEHVIDCIGKGLIDTGAINTHSGRLDDLPEELPRWGDDRENVVKAIVVV